MSEHPSCPTVTRVMLIADHRLVRDGLLARLEAVPGLDVVAEAGNAQEALAAAALRQVDLALMDLNMRVADGIALTALLHDRHPEIAVLVLSTHDQEEYVVRSIQAGARGYVLKDAPGQDIVQAIETITTGGIYLSAALARQLRRPWPKRDLLTSRERQVLKHIANGEPSRVIARALEMSVATVETHRLNIKRKLDIDGQAELIKFAVESLRLEGKI